MTSGKADAMKLFTTGKLKISGNVMASQKLEFLRKLSADGKNVLAAGRGCEISRFAANAGAVTIREQALGFEGLEDAICASPADVAGLVALALAEAVPARGPGRSVAFLALGGAAALFAALAAATRRASRGMEVDDPLLSSGPSCAGLQGVIGLTAFAVAALLVLRATPMRARLAGLLAGAGTGFLAAGVYHLDCPITHLSHVLVWHGSAILLLALLGLAFGVAVETREGARMERRRADAAARKGGAR